MAFHRDPKVPLARDTAPCQKAPAAQRLPGGDCWRRRAACAGYQARDCATLLASSLLRAIMTIAGYDDRP